MKKNIDINYIIQNGSQIAQSKLASTDGSNNKLKIDYFNFVIVIVSFIFQKCLSYFILRINYKKWDQYIGFFYSY